ncbi:MAG: hypothetical protein WCT85_00750 [Parachlamydiales bacterium]
MKTRLSSYRSVAEQNFNNMSEFNGFAGAKVLDPNDRTLTITVANSNTGTTATATIFGSTKDLTDASLPAGVTVTVAESSHLQVKTELLTNPFRIQGMKYTVTTVGQFSKPLFLYEESSTGGLIRRIWQPLNYRSAMNQLTTQIDAPTFELLVSGKTYIQFVLLASESVTFTFSLSEKSEMKNVLQGESVIERSPVSAPTGVATYDAMKMNSALGTKRYL